MPTAAGCCVKMPPVRGNHHAVPDSVLLAAFGAAADLRRGRAMAVIGPLLSATLLTLVVYEIGEGFKLRLAAAFARPGSRPGPGGADRRAERD